MNAPRVAKLDTASPPVTVIVTGFVGPYDQQIRVVGEAAKPQALPYKLQMTALDVMVAVEGAAHVQRLHQPGRGGVNGHRSVHPFQRNAIEQRAHIAQMRHRHAHLAHFAARQHMIGVIAGLGRQIERH